MRLESCRIGEGCELSKLGLVLLGAAFILYGACHLALGVVGEKATGVITGIRRQGGERGESVPNQYTYSVSYAFDLPDGRRIEGSTTRVSGAIYVKPRGTSTTKIRYFAWAPYISALEEDTRLNVGQPIVMAAGALLIAVATAKKKG